MTTIHLDCSWKFPKGITVEPLSDSHGIYGLGLVDNLHRPKYCDDPYLNPLILRPDILKQTATFPDTRRAVMLQMIPHGLRIDYSYEWAVLERMHEYAFRSNPRRPKGYDRPCITRPKEKPSEDKLVINRIFFGQRKRQLINLNGMIKRLIDEAADPDALRLARRFHPVLRENIYKAAAVSERAKQLINVFPLLGNAIYAPADQGNGAWRKKSAEAAKMVEQGVRLNRIAEFIDIPMWARKLKPPLVHWWCFFPHALQNYLPEKTWEQRLWLRPFMCYRSVETDDPEYAYWIARHVLEIGNRIRPVIGFLTDTSDWVRECRREVPRCTTRPFAPDMSLKTVGKLSQAWHEAIAVTRQKASKYRIPRRGIRRVR